VSVYVDPLINHGWHLGPSCHLFADTIEELHEMASAIGLRRSWFQGERLPHYDLTASRRARAVVRGAIELSRREAVDKWREIRLGRDTAAHPDRDRP
jgi:hypothetical protein